MAALAHAEAPLRKLYAAKGRPPDKPIPLMVADVAMVADEGAALTPLAEALAQRFWPGALTLVLDTPAGTVGFRVPDFAATRAVLLAVGGPLAVTSANRSGEPPARRVEEAVEALGPAVVLALDAGPVPGGIASTVVRVFEDRLAILRKGAISESAIRSATAGIL